MTLEVVRCRLSEEISALTQATLEIVTEQDIDFEPLLLEPAEVVITLQGAWQRSFSLLLTSARVLADWGRHRAAEGQAGKVSESRLLQRFELQLHTPAYRLTLTRSVRKFRDLSTRQIVEQVLAEHGVESLWQTKRAPRHYDYCVQYRETALSFVERLLAFEGFYFTFDSTGVFVIDDTSTAADTVDGPAELGLVESGESLTDAKPALHAARLVSRVATGSYTVSDFDWKRPQLTLAAHVELNVDDELEMYEAPAGYRDPDEGLYLAMIRLQAQRAHTRFIEGESSAGYFAAARAFTFAPGGPTGPSFAGEYLLTRVEHKLLTEQGFGDDDSAPELTYRNELEAIPLSFPFRPRWEPSRCAAARPTVWGFHTAMVRGPAGEEIHTDRHGRYKPQLHWDREAVGLDDSRWLRMLQESASSMALARVGWETGVGYIDGDPSRPMGISRLVNAAMPPAYAQPASMQTMAMGSPSSPATGGYNELKLDDTQGSQRFSMRAERNLDNIVKNDKSEQVGAAETHAVGGNLARMVQQNQTVTIGADSQTAVTGSTTLAVVGDRVRSVGSSESVTIGKQASVNVQGSDRESVGSLRQTISDAVISQLAQLLVFRLVGGCFVTVALKDIGSSAKHAYLELVGGAKVTIAALGDIKEQVGQTLKLSVGGAVLRAALGGVSRKSQSNTQGAAMIRLATDAALGAHSTVVNVTAASSLDLGGSSGAIAMTPGKIEFSGSLVLNASSKIVFLGNPLALIP